MRFALVLAVFFTTLACVGFGPDQAAVEKVQSSWGGADQLYEWGDYVAAISRVESTKQYLPLIHDAFIRMCVTEGANNRIAAARAGEAYFTSHPGDAKGAAAAAALVQRTYPSHHNCP
jgi:hypothetical protein